MVNFIVSFFEVSSVTFRGLITIKFYYFGQDIMLRTQELEFLIYDLFFSRKADLFAFSLERC